MQLDYISLKFCEEVPLLRSPDTSGLIDSDHNVPTEASAVLGPLLHREKSAPFSTREGYEFPVVHLLVPCSTPLGSL